MAKRPVEPPQAVGERQLAAWGVAPDAPADALAALLGRDVAADAAIAHRLGALADPDSARLLQQLERDAADKQVRREARRALYRLQQRGVAAPAEAVGPPPPALGPSIDGLVSPLDGRGDQLIWMVRPQPGGALHFFAVVNDPDGLREVALHAVTRKALKTLRAELEQRHELRLMPVDWRHADFLVRRGFAWAQQRGTRMEGDYPALRSQFARVPAAETSPLAAPAADPAALASSAELLAEPEFRTWFRPVEEMAPYLEELAAVKDSPLVLNEVQQQERYEEIIGRAIDALFGGEHRRVWARRMTETAVYLAAAGRPPRAAQAWAVAQALDADVAPREVPFCAQLLRASLAYFFQMAVQQQQERERSSLIVTPQQAARARERT